MKIIQCDNCGRMIHSGGRCYHCGGTRKTGHRNVINIHPNAVEDYRLTCEMLDNRKYKEALNYSEKAIEWMTDCSELYWLRMLANNGCATDYELICKGVVLEEDPDFYNAIQ